MLPLVVPDPLAAGFPVKRRYSSAMVAEPVVNTFSIVAFDPRTGDLGVAVESRYFAVGTVVPWAKAGCGAVATQAIASTSYGPRGLAALGEGRKVEEVLAELVEADSKRDIRQVAMIDAQGRVAQHTGKDCQGWAGHQAGENFAVQGNFLAGQKVVTAMAEGFTTARSGEGELAEWLVAALRAAQAEGGDRRGQQSAALIVVRDKAGLAGENDRYIDLRVDEHERPIDELERLLGLHRKFHPPH